MKKHKLIGWGWTVALLLAGPVLAQAPQPQKNGANQARTAPPLNAIASAAAKSGVSKCLGRINQVTGFVTANSQSGTYLFVSPSQPDRSMVSANIEIQTNNALTLASTSFAPTGSDGCSGVYEAVTYWAENCDLVSAKGFPQLKKMGVIQRHVQVLQGDGTMRMFLMPAGQGCISIKKEVIF